MSQAAMQEMGVPDAQLDGLSALSELPQIANENTPGGLTARRAAWPVVGLLVGGLLTLAWCAALGWGLLTVVLTILA